MKELITKVAIIGGGPAGCAAAIQLKRMGIEPIIFEMNEIGGLTVNANYIENYIGFPQGIDGREFVKLMKEHVNSLLIEIIYEEVKNGIFKDSKFILETNKTKSISDFLIFATGTIPKEFSIKGIEDLKSKNLIFYEPNDIPEEKKIKANIAIIGGGDAAFDYALNLVQKESKITILHRNEFLSCLELLYYRASNINEITIETSKIVNEFQITSDNKVRLIINKENPLIFDFVLLAIGREPNDILVKKFPNELFEKGLIYQIGDLVNQEFRQISIATADGIQCAMEIERKIKKKLNQ
ncbi:MAG TPA: NAD(P)/FAD-dependent oxidoreductase [candidate division Zixibacteria bacterium]|nr:NAD(P)/FAD-dependent oxidoreductase [candidate division Zixibacteria bacterium]